MTDKDVPTTAGGALDTILGAARAAAAARAAGKEVYTGPKVSERLRIKYGMGEAPVKRAAFYKMLDRLHEKYGLDLEEAISEAVAEAVSADSPARYFCRALKCKLRDRRMFLTSQSDAQW